MKLQRTLALAALLGVSALAQAGTQVGVNVAINQPGFYGRVELGDQPPPRVIYQQPVVIQQSPVAVYQRPIYMRVPPDHYRRWSFFCGRYRACGQPVYFVDAPPVVVRGRDPRFEHRHWEGRRWEERRHWEERHDHHDHGRGHGHRH